MQSFLQHVAASLLDKYGSDLSRLTVVFPGKRASLFLDQALAEASSAPVWTPRYQTISELFQQASPYALCDTVEGVCRLYQSYARCVGDPQTMDQFYSWGEVMLADFDDIDKHMADARRLFANVHDLRQLDDNSYITPEQEQALRTFFSNFSIEANTELKERFLHLWNRMGDIYDDFRQHLRADGLLYEGALQRDAVERKEFPADATYVFVGFNVLNAVEQALFDELKARGQAFFYWDYDVSYVGRPGAASSKHEAGYFVRRNLQRYGNELPASAFDNFSHEKQVTFVATSSDYAQASYVPEWLQSHLGSRENRTAVVLCNEQLLQAVLHTLSAAPRLQAVNVTMGYPLTDTPVYSFLCSLLSLQAEGYNPARHSFRPLQLRNARNHPYAQMVGEDVWKRLAGEGAALLDYLLEVLTQLTPHLSSLAPDASPLTAEALFQTFTVLTRLRDLMTGDRPLLDVSDQTLSRLLRSVLQTLTIPFHGEPAVGLQVMGVLETRTLDFDHLLLLGAGEGFLPKGSASTSFIPYYLREAFGLTTLRHQMAVQAYYFYRLIQRAATVTCVYNESNVGTRQNEMSRFLRQLLAETDLPIRTLRLSAESNPVEEQPPVQEKTPEVLGILHRLYDQRSPLAEQPIALSPSAMNAYTSCPLRFYYRYVRGMRIDPDPQDGLDAILFGQVFHRAAELLYRHLTADGPLVRQQDIEPFLQKGGTRLEPFVRQAFRDEFFHDQPEDYSGILLIAVRVLQTYLLQLLRHDHRLAPLRILGLEVRRTTTLDVGPIRVETGGIIDRLDEVEDPDVPGGKALRVVDYKTGGLPGSVGAIERLFAEAGQKEEYYFQTILYATIVARQEERPVTPCLFFVHKAGAASYSPKLRLARQTLHDVRDVADDFNERLHDLIAEIFDPDTPFRPTTRTDTCHFCTYRKLCGRQA